jgi:SpoIID/LytB domain protein
MPYRWHPEALAAQAVAARSYAASLIHSGGAYDVHDDTRDQVYGGVAAEEPSTNRAVARTAHLVLLWDGRPARAYYSSTSGGRTEAVAGVPYLASVEDPYDDISPHHRWGPIRVSGARLGRLLGIPPPSALDVTRNSSGRVTSVLARWPGGSRRIDGAAFQSRLRLQSTWFWIGGHRRGDTAARRGHGLRGWIVVLGSTPVSSGRASALGLARRAGARLLRSSDYPALRPGFFVVAAGPYRARSTAVSAARRLAGRFGSPYVRRLE